MVSTRSSKKKDPTAVVNSPQEETVTTPSQSPKRPPRKSRSSKEGLKSKNTGIGLSIDLHDASTKQNKKIVFDENDDDKIHVETGNEAVVEQDKQIAMQVNDNGDKKQKKATREVPAEDDDDDDDDDDAVEEVKGSIAREEIIQQIESEVKVAGKSTKKKKKRKEKKEEKVKENEDEDEGNDDDDNLDDDFFTKLETIKAEEQAKKEMESKRAKKGKHTTFVFQETNKAKKFSKPKSVGHNIQVVVLADQQETTSSNDPFTTIPTSSLTKEAMVLSRSDLKDGTDQAGKRKRNAPNRPDTSWKRSRKMNLIATSKSRFNRHGGRARPAANFVVKSNT